MQWNKARMLVCVLLLLSVTDRVSAQDIHPRGMQYVDVESDPSGAEVYKGDTLLGVTPLRVARPQAAGLVLYYPERTSWNAQRVVLGPDPLPADLGVMHIRFTQLIQLRSIPYGAAVYCGEEFLGYTPLDLPVDTATLTLNKFGYTVQEVVTIDAVDGVLLVELRVDSTFTFHDFVHSNAKPLTPGWQIVLPAGLTLSAGVAAVILKQYADARYEDYLQSRDNVLLSEAKKYDIYAGISLALMQLGLGYFILLMFGD